MDDESAVELAMREQQRQRTRASILRVAAEEFDERGYAAVALSEIAKRIELTKGSVYFHFNSKSDLAKAVIDTYFSAWESLVQAISDRELTGLTALRWLSAEVARRYRDDAGVRAPLRLMREANLVGIDLPTPFLAWVESVAKHLGEARHGGEVRPDLDLDAVAWQIVAGFFGAQEISHQLTGRSDLVERVEAMWEMFLPGIAAVRTS
ncbi:ScbR family autoregulator-binding transcription factor [Arthrobacter sp. 179]|uniref:ScbR family autoregulator-binding transcription factor n=1 Tax=Arthrobacter sp. 179 TaxID=3457734 RepID=UPI0040340CAB